MKSFWKKNSIWISIAGFAAFLGLLFFFAAVPFVNKIKSTSDAIEKKKLDNEINQQRMQQLPSIEQNYALFQKKENDLNVLLDSNSAVDFIKEMETLAQNTGNSIQFKVDDQSDSASGAAAKNIPKDDIRNKLPYADYLQMQITLAGDYPSFVKFLDKLENADYYVNVIGVNLAKNNAGDANQPAGSFDPFAASTVSLPSDKNNNAQVSELNSTIDLVIYLKK